MTMYDLMFGRNPQSALLLAVVGLREHDVERFRDVAASDDGGVIEVLTRTGGGNREDFPNLAMRARPEWRASVDDDFDSTYCSDTLEVPECWRWDVIRLVDVLQHGLRAEFARHLALTLRREPTEADRAHEAREVEVAALGKTRHFMANGHTFVPMDDAAMEVALRLAEANDGKLRSCWGIAPIALAVRRDFVQYPDARDEETRRSVTRVLVEYDLSWSTDQEYWRHCQERFAARYPKAMAWVAEGVRARRDAR